MKHTLQASLAVLTLVGAGISIASAPANDAPNTPPAQAAQPEPALPYLGVGLAPIPSAVKAQILSNVPRGQGVLVHSVTPDSPADKAGIRPYDILLSLGDQKLFTPEQVTRLVQSEQTGKTLSVQYVHQGQLASTDITLGSAPAQIAHHPGTPHQGRPYPGPGFGPHFGMGHWPNRDAFEQWRNNPQALFEDLKSWGFPKDIWQQVPWSRFQGIPGAPGPNNPGWQNAPHPGNPPQLGSAQAKPNAMNSFNAISISQVNGKYQVQVTYLEKDGTERSFSYEGSEAEVRKAIGEDSTLPDDKKQELLSSLNMDQDSGIPAFGNGPDLRTLMQQGFNSPWFQQQFNRPGWR